MPKLPQLTDSTLTLEAGVALLTFSRDDLRNALTGTHLVDDIVTTVEWANRETGVSVLVMTGGGEAFSSGGNVKQMRDRSGIFSGSEQEIADQYRKGIQRLPLALDRCAVPVIAAINGAAIGAGMDLACMCDLRLGSSKARMGETFINLGIIPGDGGAWFLQRLIGYQQAAELILSGRIIDAQEARSLGILLEVVPPDQLLRRALSLAETLASKPPQALRLSKRLLRQAGSQTLEEFLDLCAETQARCHHTSDHLEAVNAFLEKRTPRFSGG